MKDIRILILLAMAYKGLMQAIGPVPGISFAIDKPHYRLRLVEMSKSECVGGEAWLLLVGFPTQIERRKKLCLKAGGLPITLYFLGTPKSYSHTPSFRAKLDARGN